MSKSAWSAGATTKALLKEFDEVLQRKRALIERARSTRRQLDRASLALRDLLADPGFMTLLREEGVETLPTRLSRQPRPRTRRGP